MTPPDLPNVKLKYLEDDHIHRDTFTQHLEGVTWDILSSCLIVPKEVMKHIKLAPEQNEWCTVSEEVAPYVSLPLNAGYQEKDMNPMTKRLTNVIDWNNTQMTQVLFSPSWGTYDYSLHHRLNSIATLLHL